MDRKRFAVNSIHTVGPNVLVLTLRKFNKTKEYIEIKHKSGDILKICLTDLVSGKAMIGHDAEKDEFEISRRKIHLDTHQDENWSG